MYNFSKYRSLVSKALWDDVHKTLGKTRMYIVKRSTFSTWRFDDIVANNWKANNSIAECVYRLLEYIKEYVL